jgi:2-polyprenyl-3-methyl-5-hydroxy-6-metoxy-1,4-benzoquinol methylase
MNILNDKLNDMFSIAEQQKTKNKTTSILDYGLVKYMKYEYSSRSDHAKKILEKNIVEKYLLNSHFSSEDKPISLDIGCATCRYPLWLSSNGFHAVGYDIDDDAINICKIRAKGNNNIRIEKKNILEFEPEYNKYSLITCMMGTFNHIPLSSQGKFVRWIYDSLKPGGVFIFSSWNKSCSYTTHLHFYNREEKEYIQNNTETLSNIKVLLKDNNFILDNLAPIVFLPDKCYESWLGELTEDDLVTIDQNFLNILTDLNSQMYVFCLKKV